VNPRKNLSIYRPIDLPATPPALASLSKRPTLLRRPSEPRRRVKREESREYCSIVQKESVHTCCITRLHKHCIVLHNPLLEDKTLVRPAPTRHTTSLDVIVRLKTENKTLLVLWMVGSTMLTSIVVQYIAFSFASPKSIVLQNRELLL
jgi:hypothetical protein